METITRQHNLSRKDRQILINLKKSIQNLTTQIQQLAEGGQ